MVRHSVLIVEDERIVAKDLQQSLAGLGYDVLATAATADEAVTRASQRCPDVVLMDIRIKGKHDGIATAEILRARFDVPVVYLTAHADEATIERAKQTEPHGYLLKPVTTAELRSAIEVSIYKHSMERRLRERERWFSTTLRSISDAVISVDLAGNVTFMNPAAELLTGVPADAAIGRPSREILRLLDAQARALPETPLDHALRERQPVDMPYATLQADTRQQRIIADSAAPIEDHGELLGAVMVFRDVTELHLAQKQLELADRLVSLGTLAAGVAHEINNPLAVVVANAELIAQELRRLRSDHIAGVAGTGEASTRRLEEALQALGDVHSAAGRIARIVADLRAFSRPAPETPGVADVGGAIDWAVRTTSHEFKHRARLVTQLTDVPRVPIDEARLAQVLVNLLVNAAQAIEPGRFERNEVSVACRTDDHGRAVVEVRDTGSGIPPEALAKVFEPFFTTKPVGVGTGLGLSICRGIITSAGGELQVESRPGHGTVFRVVLPAAAAEEPARVVAAPATSGGPRGRILVVDDEPMILGVVRRMLEGHEVTCVESAHTALRLLNEGQRYDVILSDLMMPDMTGEAFYEQVLGTHLEQAARVVFLTGGALTGRIHSFLHSVSNLTVDKPFNIDQLRDTVRQLVVQHQARRADP